MVKLKRIHPTFYDRQVTSCILGCLREPADAPQDGLRDTIDGEWIDAPGVERWAFYRGTLVVIDQLRNGTQARIVEQGWVGEDFRFPQTPYPSLRTP